MKTNCSNKVIKWLLSIISKYVPGLIEANKIMMLRLCVCFGFVIYFWKVNIYFLKLSLQTSHNEEKDNAVFHLQHGRVSRLFSAMIFLFPFFPLLMLNHSRSPYATQWNVESLQKPKMDLKYYCFYINWSENFKVLPTLNLHTMVLPVEGYIHYGNYFGTLRAILVCMDWVEIVMKLASFHFKTKSCLFYCFIPRWKYYINGTYFQKN